MNPYAKHKHAPASAIEAVVPLGPESMWRAMMKKHASGREWSALDIVRSTGAEIEQVEDYLLRLKKAGFVKVAGKDSEGETTWRILRAVGVPPHLTEDGSLAHTPIVIENLWRCMRMLKNFTLDDVINHAHADEYPVPSMTAHVYFSALIEAGFLVALPVSKDREQGWKPRYRIRLGYEAGSLPPRIYSVSLVFDPNKEEVISKRIVAKEVKL